MGRMSEAELVREWYGFAIAISREFYFAGADREDVEQEALAALVLAIRQHDPERSRLPSFAALVIRRRLMSAVTFANRQKHAALNEALAGDVINEDGRLTTRIELVPDSKADPHAELVRRQDIATIVDVVRRRLSPLERRALVGLTDGKTYAELELELGVSSKAIDNAVQRARLKARTALAA